MANCRIGDCWNEVHYKHLQVCKACYSGLATWRGRDPADKEQRLKQIERLKTRMEFILGNPDVHPKVTPRRDDLDHGDKKTGKK